MPQAAPPPIKLSPRHKELLERLVEHHTELLKRSNALSEADRHEAQIQRIKVILLADKGLNHAHIAQTLECRTTFPFKWRRRWLELVDRLNILENEYSNFPKEISDEILTEEITNIFSYAPRRKKFTAEQIKQIAALACELPPPGKYRWSKKTWTCRDLAREAIDRGIVEDISGATVLSVLRLEPEGVKRRRVKRR